MSRLKPHISPSQRTAIPSVDRVVRDLGETDIPRPVVVELVRRELAKVRKERTGLSAEEIDGRVRAALEELRLARIRPVINATGIVVHTNFGRSPMGGAVVDAIASAASNYTNLEYDLGAGQRGRRGAYVENNLAVLCGAQAAMVVNNCAAALVLILHHLASNPGRNQVVISRGQLVQIGGGFRIPDILEASGAVLREVGTTNKTTAGDYRQAIGPETAMVLKVHHSNFFMQGFVESVSTRELAPICKRAGIPLVEDLGSGATFDTTTLGGDEREPTPAQSLRDGADLVCFSGDKLLGGPQAGIVAGSESLVAKLKHDPFYRALRCDKLILAALETTVDLLLHHRFQDIPVRQMLSVSVEDLKARALAVVSALSNLPLRIEIGAGRGQAGGGSLPRTTLPSVTIDIFADANGARALETLARRLRVGSPSVVGYIEDDRLKFDLRTVFPHQDQALAMAIRAAILQGAG